MIYFFAHIKMSYYQFNIQELLEKANDRYCNCGGKEKAAKYHTGNKDVMKEKANLEICQEKNRGKKITWHEQIRKHERVSKKKTSSKNKILIFCIA